MGPANSNSQTMVLYLATGDAPAIVTVRLEGSGNAIPPPAGGPWTREYSMPPNTVISIEDPMPAGVTVTKSPTCISAIGPIPKGSVQDCGFDATLYSGLPPAGTGSEGLFKKKGIHITSTTPIAAFAHIYGSLSSGATMLMPTNTWGYGFTSINSEQTNATGSYSFILVIANHDSTMVRIIPSVTTLANKPAGVPFDTVLNYGEIYQILGRPTSSTSGTNFTGTTVQSIPNGAGNLYPLAVFAGSGRTGGEPPCDFGGRDNDIQQLFPQQSWGKRYLLAPFSNSNNLSSLMTCVYKIAVSDPTTIVKKNGATLTGLIQGKYYLYASAIADYIEADKPIMVAQFMGGGCVAVDGDPEMDYPSPLEQSLFKTRFYRNNKESINSQYITMVIPTSGIDSLFIDGLLFSNIPAAEKYSYPHPNLPGYSVVVKKWIATKGQCIVESDSTFTGITYGLGSAESYAYNIGARLDSISRDGSVLPVSLVNISATRAREDVVINWKTVNEMNTDHYEVERSIDGNGFAKAGTVRSRGYSINGYSYAFTDGGVAKIYAYTKALYYRLSIVDKDGSKKYSDIKKVSLDNASYLSVTAMPVPFKDKIMVNINGAMSSKAAIMINDLTGKTILTQSMVFVPGSNTITIHELDKLGKGVYVLAVVTENEVTRIKILK